MKIQGIIRVAVGKYEVRVFLNEPDDFQYQQPGITDVEIAVHRHQDLPMVDLCTKLFENQKVYAVEVIGWDKNGVRVER